MIYTEDILIYLVLSLTGLFIILKIDGIIDWSWWWILSPIWIALALIAVFIIILAFVGMITSKDI